MDPSDGQIVYQCKLELPYVTKAFELLVRRYEPLVFRTCCRYLGNDQDAEEVAQDVFLRVFHKLSRFEGKAAFRTWLFRIVANQCASRYRKLRRTAELQARYVEQAAYTMEAEPKPAAPPEEIEAGVMGTAIDAVSPEDRQTLILRHVSGLSFEELADALEISLSAAKMRLYRAETRLADAYHAARGEER